MWISILWFLVIAVPADQLVRFFNTLCPEYTQARIKIIREKFNSEGVWHLLYWSYFACVKMWASEIARTTEEKPAFENNKDIGSQQKSLVPTGYQMNMYSPHWWPDEHFFLSLLLIRWHWLVIGNHHFSVTIGNQVTMGFQLLFVHFILSIYVQVVRRQKLFCEWWSTVYSKCLIISDKQNRKVDVAVMLYTYKYCLLGCDAMPSAR
jgi:hypothetical protein